MLRRLASGVGVVLVGMLLFSAFPGKASASAGDDMYCFGARYAVGQPFIDPTKLRAGELTDLGVDPIVRIDRIQRPIGGSDQTIGYVYYNRAGLAEISSAPESEMTTDEKDAFSAVLSRIGVAPHPPVLGSGSKFGDGLVRFFAGTKVKNALNSKLALAQCVNTSDKK